MKKLGFTSIRLKLILIFIGIMLGACQLAIINFVNYYFDRVVNDLETQLMTESRLIKQLADQTDLSAEEIIRLSSSSFYEMNHYVKVQDIPVEIDESKQKMLENGDSVYVMVEREDRKIHATLFKIEKYYVLLIPYVAAHFNTIEKLVVITLLVCVAIGSIMILISVRQITQPLKKLTAATREVAKGKFTVQVPYSGKDEVAMLAQYFNQMVQELKHIEYLRKDFVNSVSHEFKTPVSSIHGFAQLLKTESLPKEKFQEYTDVIIEETERLSKLSSNILKLSRVENQSMITQRTSFSLDEQIRKTILLLEREWQEKELEFDLHLQKIDYWGDEELIQQIWINLIGNAIKYSYTGGIITVMLSHMGDVIRIQIRDEGSGIPETALKRIFEQFYQAEGSHSQEGNGLGLAIVKRVVELCGGFVSVQSEEGKGAVFNVELPLSSLE
ncbi:MAG: ATP-binding protein [Bacillota bacterium]